ncbi:MAG TPA: alanine racemase [Feifaniaceae bacterium]|nr:alanine racemase [Feifaniaceae bacterium]
MLRPTHVIVDLDALRYNISALRGHVGKDTKFMAVVKANAYGHGIVETSLAAQYAGAEYLGVSIPEEGMKLRDAGIKADILILGGMLPESAELAVAYNLIPTVYSAALLEALQREANRQNSVCRIHIKADTGMNRIGIKTVEEFRALLKQALHSPNIRVEGLFTHFAVSELADKSFTREQAGRFMEFVRAAREMGVSPLLHASNSGALLDLPEELRFDLVRAGIAMYGYHPGPGCGEGVDLKPVLTWKTAVTHVKSIDPGDTVSYGRRYTAKEPRVIATLPAGYGDGYKRCLSNKAYVLIHGKRVPVVGTVCMDQFMVDVTEIEGVKVGDEAVLLGRQGGASFDADDMAALADTISYEILLSINDRVPRVYTGGYRA